MPSLSLNPLPHKPHRGPAVPSAYSSLPPYSARLPPLAGLVSGIITSDAFLHSLIAIMSPGPPSPPSFWFSPQHPSLPQGRDCHLTVTAPSAPHDLRSSSGKGRVMAWQTHIYRKRRVPGPDAAAWLARQRTPRQQGVPGRVPGSITISGGSRERRASYLLSRKKVHVE